MPCLCECGFETRRLGRSLWGEGKADIGEGLTPCSKDSTSLLSPFPLVSLFLLL